VLLKAEGHEAIPTFTFADFLKETGAVPMTRADNGIWSIEWGPIPPGVYRYYFLVDGVLTADPRSPDTSESLNYVQSMYEIPGADFSEYKADVPHGAIASVWYNSSTLGHLRRMHVYTPPGYEAGNKSYPVLYLLHGGGDTDDGWPTIGRAGAILDNLIASHKAQPMIVVMPAGHISRSFQLRPNMTAMGHDAFNEDLTGSVLPYIESHYRTISDRQHRAIAGLSMGGLQTLTISLNHSDLFSYVGIFSSGWFPQALAEEEKTDLSAYKTTGKPFQLYWMGLGKLDIAYKNGLASADLLKKYGVPLTLHESGGFHAWNNWRDYLAIFAPQLFQ
jgi:enterochelin esterase family protein